MATKTQDPIDQNGTEPTAVISAVPLTAQEQQWIHSVIGQVAIGRSEGMFLAAGILKKLEQSLGIESPS